MTQIKICGLFRYCDIDFVNEAMPDYIGFILNFPKSHRNLSIEAASELRRNLSSGIKAAGVFVNQPEETILEAIEKIDLDVIQLHGQEKNEFISSLKKKTTLPVWKAFKVQHISDLTAAEESIADEILLDNGYGTGTAFDWSCATTVTRPFLLAGGLTPENIPDAIKTLHPKLLDISSGVETDKVKDRCKILAAVQAAHSFS